MIETLIFESSGSPCKCWKQMMCAKDLKKVQFVLEILSTLKICYPMTSENFLGEEILWFLHVVI